MIHCNYEIAFRYVNGNVKRREFQESQKNLSVTFKQKILTIESHEDSKIKVLWDFKVGKCFKGGEISLNNVLSWTKILQLLTMNPKITPALNKVECLKCKWVVVTLPTRLKDKSESKLLRGEKIVKVASCESRNYVPRHFFPWNHPVSQKTRKLYIYIYIIYIYIGFITICLISLNFIKNSLSSYRVFTKNVGATLSLKINIRIVVKSAINLTRTKKCFNFPSPLDQENLAF